MGYAEVYGGLLKEIAEEADAIALRYFRGDELRIDRDGERARVAFALVGVSRGGRVPRWKAAPGFARDEPGQSDGFYNWHRAKQERARPGEDSRSAGCGAQQPLVWRILAAHAGRRRRDRGGARLDFEAVGPRAARNHGRGSRGPLDKRARRANDLYRTVSQHKWKNSR